MWLQPQARAGAQAQEATGPGQVPVVAAERQADDTSAGPLSDTIRAGPITFLFGADGRGLAEALAATASRPLPVMPATHREGEPPGIVQHAPDHA
jgi:hypothetical protein